MKKHHVPVAIVTIGVGLAYGIIRYNSPTVPKLPMPTVEKSGVVVEVESRQAVLLDVRRDDEWQAGHAVGAIHWDLAKLESGQLPPNVPKDAKVYIYCRSGNRAGVAKDILTDNGYESVSNLGGLTDWQRMGGEVVR
jgi:rhodanese-related sulfurtransferase